MIELVRASDRVVDFEAFVRDVFYREEAASTGVGNEIAVPHARTDAVTSLILAFGRSGAGVNFL